MWDVKDSKELRMAPRTLTLANGGARKVEVLTPREGRLVSY